jgi:hypothetical protein
MAELEDENEPFDPINLPALLADLSDAVAVGKITFNGSRIPMLLLGASRWTTQLILEREKLLREKVVLQDLIKRRKS